MEKRLEEKGPFLSAIKALRMLDPIKLVVGELAGQRINNVTAIAKQQEDILKALRAQTIPKIVA